MFHLFMKKYLFGNIAAGWAHLIWGDRSLATGVWSDHWPVVVNVQVFGTAKLEGIILVILASSEVFDLFRNMSDTTAFVTLLFAVNKPKLEIFIAESSTLSRVFSLNKIISNIWSFKAVTVSIQQTKRLESSQRSGIMTFESQKIKNKTQEIILFIWW